MVAATIGPFCVGVVERRSATFWNVVKRETTETPSWNLDRWGHTHRELEDELGDKEEEGDPRATNLLALVFGFSTNHTHKIQWPIHSTKKNNQKIHPVVWLGREILLPTYVRPKSATPTRQDDGRTRGIEEADGEATALKSGFCVAGNTYCLVHSNSR